MSPIGQLVPGDAPDKGGPSRDMVWLGAVSMYLTTFLALTGQGAPPREAATATLLMLGGAEGLRRLIGGRSGDGLGGR